MAPHCLEFGDDFILFFAEAIGSKLAYCVPHSNSVAPCADRIWSNHVSHEDHPFVLLCAASPCSSVQRESSKAAR